MLNKSDPAGESSRGPAVIAAKLLFLLARKQLEPVPDYL
jgi:hypothetical protein